jgi:hypothetical protein
MTRVFKKNVESCWECPGRDKYIVKMNDNGDVIGDGYCAQFDRGIPREHLVTRTRFNNFPAFCKLKMAR